MVSRCPMGFAMGTLGLSLALAGCPRDPSSTPTRPAESPLAVEETSPRPAAETDVEAPAEPDPPPPPPITEPVVVDASAAAHAFVQDALLDHPLAADERVHFVPIADPSHHALEHFYGALRALQKAPEGSETVVRIGFYGASSVAIDRYTAYLRGYLQHRFGDAGVGFIATVPLWTWHRHNAVRLDATRRWRIEHAQRKTGKLDGYYGLLGASAHTKAKNARATIKPKSTALSNPATCDAITLQYLAQPGGGSFDVLRDRDVVLTVETHAESVAPGFVELPAPVGDEPSLPLTMRVNGDGEVRLFGATIDRKGSGIVLDTLGIGGTRAANMLDWSEEVWFPALKRRDYDLLLIAYGGNEAVDEDEPIATYEANLVDVLEHFERALPEASCVLIGPQDFRRHTDDGQWVARPRIDKIIAVQRRVAADHGCGFFDIRAFMGGKGSMNGWVDNEPPLAKADHLHLTPLGYLHLGRVLTDALMARFDQPLDSRDD